MQCPLVSAYAGAFCGSSEPTAVSRKSAVQVARPSYLPIPLYVLAPLEYDTSTDGPPMTAPYVGGKRKSPGSELGATQPARAMPATRHSVNSGQDRRPMMTRRYGWMRTDDASLNCRRVSAGR